MTDEIKEKIALLISDKEDSFEELVSELEDLEIHATAFYDWEESKSFVEEEEINFLIVDINYSKDLVGPATILKDVFKENPECFCILFGTEEDLNGKTSTIAGHSATLKSDYASEDLKGIFATGETEGQKLLDIDSFKDEVLEVVFFIEENGEKIRCEIIEAAKEYVLFCSKTQIKDISVITVIDLRYGLEGSEREINLRGKIDSDEYEEEEELYIYEYTVDDSAQEELEKIISRRSKIQDKINSFLKESQGIE
jgi:hypothetical protein